MSLNPGTVYWMDVSDNAGYNINQKLKIKVAKWGTPKKNSLLVISLTVTVTLLVITLTVTVTILVITLKNNYIFSDQINKQLH
jgi:hypothetical protein